MADHPLAHLVDEYLEKFGAWPDVDIGVARQMLLTLLDLAAAHGEAKALKGLLASQLAAAESEAT